MLDVEIALLYQWGLGETHKIMSWNLYASHTHLINTGKVIVVTTGEQSTMGTIAGAKFRLRSALAPCLLILAAISLSAPAFAHHGYSAYDMTKVHSAKATITSFELANPHSSITCDIVGDDGKVQHWSIETGAPMRGMRAAGFTQDTLKPGDVVTIFYYAAKNGSPVGAFSKVILPDGKVMPPPGVSVQGQPSPQSQ
jgi:hypothetical protein